MVFRVSPVQDAPVGSRAAIFEDLNREIFRGGHKLVKFLHRIQILQVIPREHFPFDDAVEIDQIADHAVLWSTGPLTVTSSV